MRLDWNEIRARAARFAEKWKGAAYERGETQTFYNEFFEVFGVPRRRVASFEHGVRLADNKRGFLDLFWKGKLLVEQKSAGRDLTAARRQALSYFPGLKDHELPRYILLSDFQTFELYDLDIDPDTPLRFSLPDLPDHVQAFGFIVGQERRIFRDQDPVNIQASEMMGALHDALEASGYRGHALERFLVRLLFCLFADDTGIFQPLGSFEQFIRERTSEDGRDVGARLEELFQVLNTPETERLRNLDADLAQFPYINGDLFAEQLRITAFDRDMREKLLACCGFQWEKISPAIFGSLFQSVMDSGERRRKGAHYTSEKNILKVIEPLFMDDLRAEFARIRARRDTGRNSALRDFHARLGALTFFDPACGCGNFLVIAYRELRELELEVIRELNPEGQRVTDVGLLSKVDVDQFYGIEIEEFPARIAEVAMWMMDHIMNVKLSAAFGESYLRIPLRTSPNIRHADALETEWAEVLAPEKCSYVFGNPPFVGAKLQSEKQRQQVRALAGLGPSGGTLDYVCAWFLKAGAYARRAEGRPPRIAFVATNSITQGEQVAQLWPLLFDRYQLEIAFGHRTFNWSSDARGRAHVHCVILGLTRRDDEPADKRLFTYNDIDGDPSESILLCISPYLIDASNLSNKHIVLHETTVAPKNMPPMLFGNMPNDGGNLILTQNEYDDFISRYPNDKNLVRPLIGASNLIDGKSRYCLWLQNVSPNVLRNNTFIKDRLRQTESYRLASRRLATNRLANTPHLFGEIRQISDNIVVIPRHSSENRKYVPVQFYNDGSIVHDSCNFIQRTNVFAFGMIVSGMHMAWLRYI
jgi:hypothetical protein